MKGFVAVQRTLFSRSCLVDSIVIPGARKSSSNGSTSQGLDGQEYKGKKSTEFSGGGGGGGNGGGWACATGPNSGGIGGAGSMTPCAGGILLLILADSASCSFHGFIGTEFSLYIGYLDFFPILRRYSFWISTSPCDRVTAFYLMSPIYYKLCCRNVK